jgi:hypothetical protein
MQSLRVDNAAVLQLQVTKGEQQFLSTLPHGGAAQFLTVLKPCSILLPHDHPRATEFFSVFFGMSRSHSCLSLTSGCADKRSFVHVGR